MIKPVLLLVASAAALGMSPMAEHVVGQKGKQFSTSELRVKVGDTVVFRNNDDVTHNVFSSAEGMKFNLRSQAPGASSPIVLDRAGTAEVRCAFHPTMRMTITVTR